MCVARNKFYLIILTTKQIKTNWVKHRPITKVQYDEMKSKIISDRRGTAEMQKKWKEPSSDNTPAIVNTINTYLRTI